MNMIGKNLSFPRRPLAKRSFQSLTSILAAAVLAVVVAATPIGAEAQGNAAATNKNIVAVFSLSGPLTEIPADETFAMFNVPGISLRELVKRLDKAARDPAVKAVVILPDAAAMGLGQVEEVRAEIAQIRGHDKEVYVHGDSLLMGQYVLACGASRISVVPTGTVMIPGLDGSSMHVRGLLDKIGVKPDFLTEGAYKSEAELFMREQPSPEADEMMNWIFDSLYSSFKDLIAKGRNADAAKVQAWVDNGLYTSEQAKAAGLIDAVEHREDFEAMLKQKYGRNVVFDKKYGSENQTDVDFSSPFAFLKIWSHLLGAGQKHQSNRRHRLRERPDHGRKRPSQPVRCERGRFQRGCERGAGEGGGG